jgi:serine/threonine-protein kinase
LDIVDDLIGATIAGQFTLLRKLGSGGMGSVYEARREGTPELVAVKVLHEGVVEPGSRGASRFRREAAAAAALDGPHIVRVLDSGIDPATGAPYLAMERLEGGDLQQWIERVGPLAPGAALRVAGQALLGLARAHEAGVVHRDVKPANLFFARGGSGDVTVKLLDFGLAKILASPLSLPHTAGLTRTGEVFGSPLYLSPEQAQSTRDVDARTDLWSLGGTLYFMLAGRAPHQHVQNLRRMLIAICATAAPPLRSLAPWVSPEVAALVHRAIEIDPARRFQSAASMLEAIRVLLGGASLDLREDMLVGAGREGHSPALPVTDDSPTELATTDGSTKPPAGPV